MSVDLTKPAAWVLVPRHVMDQTRQAIMDHVPPGTTKSELMHDIDSGVNSSDVVPEDFR